jgi:hypothetical protein
MTIHVVRKGSIYRTEVVLKTKTNLCYYRMCCGISYCSDWIRFKTRFWDIG